MRKRRTFQPELKARLVLEELTGTKSAAEICREHQLSAQVFSRWKTELIERAPEIFTTRPSRGDEQARIAELERMVGRLTMELEVAKKPPTSWSLPRSATGGSQDARSRVPHRLGVCYTGL